MSWRFELVAGPYNRLLGGLAWDGAAMLFSDVMDNTILRFDPRKGKVTVWRKHTSRTNGIAFGDDGVLFGCQEGSRRIVRYEPNGLALLTNQHMPDGRVHNHPCNVAVDSHLRIWFTDPYNELAAAGPQLFGRLDHASVLRLDLDPAPQRRTWTLRRMTFDTVNPRGLALSPEQKTLYVSDNDTTPGAQRKLCSYEVLEDGTLGTQRVLLTFGADARGVHRGIEGLCVDMDGNVVTVGGWRRSGAGPLACVVAPSGAVLESHLLPEDLPVNCAFGDVGLDSLYVTTTTGCLLRARRIGRKGHALLAAR